jgi:hypothetical protein
VESKNLSGIKRPPNQQGVRLRGSGLPHLVRRLHAEDPKTFGEDRSHRLHQGKEDASQSALRTSKSGLTAAILALVEAVRSVLAEGLGILGVKAPDEMR